MALPSEQLLRSLHDEIIMARGRVYAVGEATPLQRMEMPDGQALFLKREDLSAMHAYKWRGAANRIAQIPSGKAFVVAASAGNHAQGVALAAAQREDCHAKIFMPLNTPQMKQDSVRRLGGDSVSIELIGDTFARALEAAIDCAENEGRLLVHPYDDLSVIAGQGTMADEIVMSGEGPFDEAWLQIGGGGMAAGVAVWLKKYFPDIKIYGVEGVDQASMARAMEVGRPEDLEYVDVFCDGTAVRRAGDVTFQVCREVVDEYVQVSNEEVCAAMQFLWEKKRVIPEPAGAMGLAAWLRHGIAAPGKKILCVLCGANMDFAQLQKIVRYARIGSARRRYLRFEIEERPGTLLELIQEFRTRANIVEFLYGKTHDSKAYPVIGVDIHDRDYDEVAEHWRTLGIDFEDVSGTPDVEFRAISYRASIISNPLLVKVEFPERAGALADFLEASANRGNVCYFNYQYSGERVGCALVGFEFRNLAERALFLQFVAEHGTAVRTIHVMEEAVTSHLLGLSL